LAKIDFKFPPLKHVKIIAHGLDYAGRVIRCEWDGHTKNYVIEYASNGDIKSGTFLEDELA
jgi:hypothetical protein